MADGRGFPCNSGFCVLYCHSKSENNGRCAGERKQHPAAEWGEKPREKVTVMPARLRQAKSDTLCTGPFGFAIPEAEMRSAARGHFRPCVLFCTGTDFLGEKQDFS